MKRPSGPALRAIALIAFCGGFDFFGTQLAAQSFATPALNAYGKLPLSFEANQGQSDPQVRFTSRGNGYSLFLTDTEAVLSLAKGRTPRPNAAPASRPQIAKSDVVRMQLAGAQPGLRVSGEEQQPGTANYFIGRDPAKWHSNVPTYAKVRYAGVYPGVDLVYYGNQRQLEYDFVVAPKANAKAIRLHFAGAKQLSIGRDQNLVIAANDGQIAFHKPVVYQEKEGQQQPVAGQFKLLADNTVGFTLGRYNHAEPLVIDPVLSYSTYLGGSVGEMATGIAIDASGNAYVTGLAFSANFPVTPGALQSAKNTTTYEADGFVTKLNSTGTALIYSTYLGGATGGATPSGIAVDNSGNAYVTGGTAYLNDFPVTPGAFQTSSSGGTSFVAKLGPSGTDLVYSTLLGGAGTTGIAVDPSGDAFLTGQANSDFPVTPGAFQTVDQSQYTGFVAELNPQGSHLVYATFLGGTGYEQGTCIALDAAGDAYVGGYTQSSDFPVTPGAYQPTKHALANGYVAELNPAGTALVYATYLGGSTFLQGDNHQTQDFTYFDSISAIAVDSNGSAYVTGKAYSPDFPVTTGAYQTVDQDQTPTIPSAFVTKFNPDGTGLVYSTFLGSDDYGVGIKVDGQGDASIVGDAQTTGFPVTPGAFQPTSYGTATVFITKLNPAGTALLYSTLFGTPGLPYSAYVYDIPAGIALDNAGGTYIAGEDFTLGIPTTAGAFQTTHPSNEASFVAKFALGPVQSPTGTTTTETSSANPQTVGLPVTFTALVSPKLGSGVPTGSIVFTVDGQSPTTVPLDGTAHAAFSTSALTVGSHGILAKYAGSTFFTGSTVNFIQTITLPVAATPVLSPSGGTYTSAQLLTLTDTTPGAKVYFTTDGTPPLTTSMRSSVPVPVIATETVRAFATAPGYLNSAVASASYVIIGSPTALAFPATAIATPRATLNVVADGFGEITTCVFHYGTNPAALTSSISCTPVNGIYVPTVLSSTPSTLLPGTTYYFQATVTTAGGSATSALLSFATN